MASKFKVHELLSREELSSLEEFAREPGRTIDECMEWLLAHGFNVSHGAVGNWKQKFDLEDRVRSSSALAREFLAAAQEGKGSAAIADANLEKLQQMIFEQMLRLQEGDGPDTKELWALSMAVKNGVQGKRHVEKLKEEMKTALASVEKDAKQGASGEDVVKKVREILGIAA